MADQTRGGETAAIRERAAAFAAVHSYRAVYGNPIRRDFEPLVAALCEFWLDRFREGHPLPIWFGAAKNQKAADPGADTTEALSAYESLEKDGR